MLSAAIGTLAGVKILVIGSGGREHAIIRRLSADSPAPDLHAAPGNPGIEALATCHDVAVGDLDAQVDLARDLDVDLVVVGPEAPLVAGVADRLREAGIAVFGPSAAAAMLEGSKSFAKEVMAAAGVFIHRRYDNDCDTTFVWDDTCVLEVSPFCASEPSQKRFLVGSSGS